MKTKKHSELRVKRGKRKPISLKRDNLKNHAWYAAAALKFGISGARQTKGN